jgi:ATP-dependent exoDNAse (exonuclease V) beta subunit
VQLHAEVSLPTAGLRDDGPQSGSSQLGTAIGTLVHRLFEMPGALQHQTPQAFRKLLEAMAAGLLLAPSPLEGAGDEESPILADPETIRVVADAVEQIWQRLHKATGAQVRELIEAAGETEVPFVLKVGRWQISGRYDKLLARNGGFEIVDWKTDREAEPETIVRRHEPQMRLYALALRRTGMAALVDGKIRVHLAMLYPMLVAPLSFSPADLETFAKELANELEEMDAYEDGVG